MILLPVLPLLVPLATAVLTLSIRRYRMAQHAVAILGSATLLFSSIALFLRVWRSGPLVMEMGDWPAPFGIIVYVDTLASSLVVATALVHGAVTIYGVASSDEDRRRSDYWPLVNTMVMGVQGAFLTGDIFNLYVWFEVLLISSFVLVSLGNVRRQIEAAAKYVVLNLLSSTSFLTAIALLYGVTGSLNLAELSVKVRNPEAESLISIIAVLFVVGFGIKAAMFPFSLWLPTAYGSPPAALASLLAALLTKVGVYSFLRTKALLFDGVSWFDEVLLLGAICSIGIGALGALSQSRLRGVIVHTVVFAVGFMLLGVAMGTHAGLTGTIVYLLSDMVMVTAFVLIGGEAERITGQEKLAEMGGIYRRYPWLALSFIIVGFSVAGFPPMIGFWGKLAIFQALVEWGWWSAMLVALVGSAMVLGAVGQAWSLGFWQPLQEHRNMDTLTFSKSLPIVLMVALVVFVSVLPGPLFDVAERAATELTDLDAYRRAVLR
ncbi:MAG: Na+/H+ antiporter subunit D [Myxococcales bacterium]|nr:Na+/H+ antiporter subunit D [Myxococcales bacterium]